MWSNRWLGENITQQKRADNPQKLAPVALRLIKEWYAEKQAVGGDDFQKQAEERMLTRSHHSEQMDAHSVTQRQNEDTHKKLDDQTKQLDTMQESLNKLTATRKTRKDEQKADNPFKGDTVTYQEKQYIVDESFQGLREDRGGQIWQDTGRGI